MLASPRLPAFEVRKLKPNSTIGYITRHPDGVIIMNDAFVKERKDKEIQAKKNEIAGSLFEGMADEFEDANKMSDRSMAVRANILSVLRPTPWRKWSLTEFLIEAISRYLGQFSETEYKQGLRELIMSGHIQTADNKKYHGAPVVNDQTVFGLVE